MRDPRSRSPRRCRSPSPSRDLRALSPTELSREAHTRLNSVGSLFDSLVEEGSGMLSISKLKAWLTSPAGGSPLSTEETTKIIAQCNGNDDVKMSFADFAALWAGGSTMGGGLTPSEPPSSARAIEDAFGVLDQSGSGTLSVDELRVILKRPDGGTPLSEIECQEVLAQIDTTDGVVRMDALSSWAAHNAESTSKGSTPNTSAPGAVRSPTLTGNWTAAVRVPERGGLLSSSDVDEVDSGKAQQTWQEILTKYERPGWVLEALDHAAACAIEDTMQKFNKMRAHCAEKGGYLQSLAISPNSLTPSL